MCMKNTSSVSWVGTNISIRNRGVIVCGSSTQGVPVFASCRRSSSEISAVSINGLELPMSTLDTVVARENCSAGGRDPGPKDCGTYSFHFGNVLFKRNVEHDREGTCLIDSQCATNQLPRFVSEKMRWT